MTLPDLHALRSQCDTARERMMHHGCDIATLDMLMDAENAMCDAVTEHARAAVPLAWEPRHGVAPVGQAVATIGRGPYRIILTWLPSGWEAIVWHPLQSRITVGPHDTPRAACEAALAAMRAEGGSWTRSPADYLTESLEAP